jgi:hypothetical protein
MDSAPEDILYEIFKHIKYYFPILSQIGRKYNYFCHKSGRICDKKEKYFYKRLEDFVLIRGSAAAKIFNFNDIGLCTKAIKFGRIDLLKWAIDNGFFIPHYCCHLACKYDRFDILRFLIDKGYEYNSINAINPKIFNKKISLKEIKILEEIRGAIKIPKLYFSKILFELFRIGRFDLIPPYYEYIKKEIKVDEKFMFWSPHINKLCIKMSEEMLLLFTSFLFPFYYYELTCFVLRTYSIEEIKYLFEKYSNIFYFKKIDMIYRPYHEILRFNSIEIIEWAISKGFELSSDEFMFHNIDQNSLLKEEVSDNFAKELIFKYKINISKDFGYDCIMAGRFDFFEWCIEKGFIKNIFEESAAKIRKFCIFILSRSLKKNLKKIVEYFNDKFNFKFIDELTSISFKFWEPFEYDDAEFMFKSFSKNKKLYKLISKNMIWNWLQFTINNKNKRLFKLYWDYCFKYRNFNKITLIDLISAAYEKNRFDVIKLIIKDVGEEKISLFPNEEKYMKYRGKKDNFNKKMDLEWLISGRNPYHHQAKPLDNSSARMIDRWRASSFI